jgi:hypothetical protein
MGHDVSLETLERSAIEGTLTLEDVDQRLERGGYTHEQIDDVLVAIVQTRIALKAKPVSPLPPVPVKDDYLP